MRCPILRRIGVVAASRAGATAVVDADSAVSYRRLWDDAQGWQHELGGLPAGAVVAIRDPGTAGLPAAFLGVRAAGLVPLLIDPLLPRQRTEMFLAAARPVAVAEPAAGHVAVLGEPNPVRLHQDAGYVTFSSGTQGPPKGIVGNAAGLLHFLEWERRTLGITTEARIAMVTSPSFDVVLREMLLAALVGAELHVPGPATRTDPGQILTWLAAAAVDTVHVVPSLATRWAMATPAQRLPALRRTLFAGEPLHGRQVTLWRDRAPRSKIINLYGPSETTLAKFWHEIGPDPEPGIQPVGRPLPGTILHRHRLPGRRDTFRIEIETPYGSLGYLSGTAGSGDDALLTRREGRTRFLTQDRGVLMSSSLLLVEGRLDTLVKRRGVLFDTALVESLTMDEPGVTHACCLKVRVETTGEIVLAVAGIASPQALSRRLRRTLGPGAPDRLIVRPALPLLPNGKVDRRRLQAELSEPEAR